MSSPSMLKETLKAEAISLGFVAVGIACPQTVPQNIQDEYLKQIRPETVGDMKYLLRNKEIRFDPCKLLPNAKSLIVLAFNYYPPIKQNCESPQVSFYAYGKDYHLVLKKKLFKLVDILKKHSSEKFKARCFVDSAPLMEKYWATQAGIGSVGKNGLLIVPNHGTFCFLASIITTLPLPIDNPITKPLCINCNKCIESCPTQALIGNGQIIPNKCLSYQTIENQGDIELSSIQGMQNIFGCDICQKICPHNNALQPHKEAELIINNHILSMNFKDWQEISEDEFQNIFEESPLQRAGHKNLLRNLQSLQKSNEKHYNK